MNRIRRRRLQAYFTSAVLCMAHVFGSAHTTSYAAPAKANVVVEEESADAELSNSVYIIQKKMASKADNIEFIIDTEVPRATIAPSIDCISTSKASMKTIEPTETPKVIETEAPKVNDNIKTEEPKVEETVKPTIKPTIKPTVKPTEEPKIEVTVKPTVKPTIKPTVKPTEEAPVDEKPTVDDSTEYDFQLSNSEIELIALITIGEAEGESVEGKRMVIDVILNRMDSCGFPDTVKGVIYQKGQFECTWNGRLNRCTVTDEVRQLVREELKSRSNSEVLYFRTGHYHGFGTPVVKVGNHYFSK